VQKADERKFRLDVAAQQEEKARARAREERVFQISVKEQELAAAEDRDRRNKTFESEMAVAKNKVDLAMQKENHKHAEAQSDRVINHAQAIQIENILAQKARDSQYAADRAQDKTEQAARDRATEAFRAEEQKARNTAERLRLEHQKADDAHKARMEGFEKERIERESMLKDKEVLYPQIGDPFFSKKIATKKDKTATVRIEGETASVFSNDLNLLKTLENIGCHVDYTEVDDTIIVGVKYFVREPKYNYRIYLKSKRVNDEFRNKLQNFIKRYENTSTVIVPSGALTNWLSDDTNYVRGSWSYHWNKCYNSSNYFIDYNDESTLTLFSLIF
jgi:hypothetical protein